MWITKLVLNLQHRAVRRDLSSPYEMHRTLSLAVSEALKQGTERMLWRLEPIRSHQAPVVLVQTLTEPCWDRVMVKYPGYARVFPPKAWEPNLPKGTRYRFRLRANPVKRDRASGKRVALKTREEKITWLQRRLQAGGMDLAEGEEGLWVDILQDAFLRARKKEFELQLQAVLFEGVLQVLDPQRAVQTLRQGIGPGKALGLGLLSLMRLRT